MKYQANPVIVDAYVITGVFKEHEYDDVVKCELTLDNGEKVIATPEMMSRMTPALGDYWVIQEDGYVYLNPKVVFERKYRPVQA